LPAELARRLRVVPLSDELWALGRSTAKATRLAVPVLIDAEGGICWPQSAEDDTNTALCCAANPTAFPHLLFAPGRVLLVGDEIRAALVAKSPPGLRFDLRSENGRLRVVLLWRGTPGAKADSQPAAAEGEPAEVARYWWDPFEMAFVGPLADRLPDPPGGLFELDLAASEALVPVGGELPEPTPDSQPADDDWP
jgi:hypothetical protein